MEDPLLHKKTELARKRDELMGGQFVHNGTELDMHFYNGVWKVIIPQAYAVALAEMHEQKQKQSHWSWYVFISPAFSNLQILKVLGV